MMNTINYLLSTINSKSPDGDGWHIVGRIYFGGDIVLLMLPLVLSDYESRRAGA